MLKIRKRYGKDELPASFALCNSVFEDAKNMLNANFCLYVMLCITSCYMVCFLMPFIEIVISHLLSSFSIISSCFRTHCSVSFKSKIKRISPRIANTHFIGSELWFDICCILYYILYSMCACAYTHNCMTLSLLFMAVRIVSITIVKRKKIFHLFGTWNSMQSRKSVLRTAFQQRVNILQPNHCYIALRIVYIV